MKTNKWIKKKGAINLQKNIRYVNEIPIAVIQSDSNIITDAQSALDIIVSLVFEEQCSRVAINREAFGNDFFKLRTGLAGEILQKFANYAVKLAIFGDFTGYTGKALRDFIYECNQGNMLFFVADAQEAVDRLATAK